MLISKHEQYYIHVSLTGLYFTGELRIHICTESMPSVIYKPSWKEKKEANSS